MLTSRQSEENLDIQTRSAVAVANFVGFCAQYKLSQPPEKIVKNLCTFLCQDTERTPTFASTHKQEKGILSFVAASKEVPVNGANGKGAPEKAESALESEKTRLSGRGAGLAFNQLSTLFGARLLDIIPGMWQSMVGGLLSACSTGTSDKSGDHALD
jgi:TATA-binding protein-associated factor